MNILMITRVSSKEFPGGDTIQIQETAKSLRELNHKVDIKYADEEIDYSPYDLMHFFNIIRPDDILYHISKTNIPFVVSAIYLDYSIVEKNSSKIRSFLFNLLNSDSIEYFKCIARHSLGREKIKTYKYFLKGQRNSINYILTKTKAIIFITEVEKRRFELNYSYTCPHYIVSNGFNDSIFDFHDIDYSNKKDAICVARIEPRKNQYNLIKIFNNLPYNLTIIGKADRNHEEYYQKCKAEANNNIQFINHIDQKNLSEFYKKSKVHILPSYSECSPLSTMEAASMGCIPVISFQTDDYKNYDGYAEFCDATDNNSINHAINNAFVQSIEKNKNISNFVVKNYSWHSVANQINLIYKSIINI